MSKMYFTFASLDFTFNRPNEVQESNEARIHLFHGQASEPYGSIPSMTSGSNLHWQSSSKTIMQSSS